MEQQEKINFDIDIVLPYVDNRDEVWKNTLIDYCVKRNLTKHIVSMVGTRFDSMGFLPYLIELIHKNMPWVRTIFLLVANKEQVPNNIRKDKLRVVRHEEFIPTKYLPTFNSTTIEMFLWNIRDLGEHFIYFNDDMFPLLPLEKEDFYFNDKIIKMNYNMRERNDEEQFFKVCFNSYYHVLKALNKDYEIVKFERVEHTISPMIKSHCKECFTLLQNDILPNISAFRKDTQHNQYMYLIYQKYKYGAKPSEIPFRFYELHRLNDNFYNELVEKNCKIICVNDNSSKKTKEQIALLKEILTIFKEKKND